MSRKPSPRRTDCPYHVTARTNNQEWFEIPLDQVWKIFEDQLFFIHHAFGIQIHSFVLMTNHFHLLLSDPNGKISEALRWLMTESSREIAQKSGRKNRIYGQKNFKSLIGSYHYYMHAYKYIYRNPVQAGACKRVEEYPYSTLAGLIGLTPLKIPLTQDLLFGDFDRNLRWLNTAVEKKDWDSVRTALRKSEFKLRHQCFRNREHPLENRLL